MGVSLILGNSLSPIEIYALCETYSVQGQTFVECYNSPPTVEHANAYIVSTHHHRTIPIPFLTTLDGRATATFSTKTQIVSPKVLCSHLGSSTKPLTTQLLNPHNQNLT